jgi:DNA adenine methylase
VIEPFFGSGAVLLSRPHPPRIETANDWDCCLANFWRATQFDPEGVVEWCDWPVSEVDLHAFHRYLVVGEDAAAFRERMRSDPDDHVHFQCYRCGTTFCAGCTQEEKT